MIRLVLVGLAVLSLLGVAGCRTAAPTSEPMPAKSSVRREPTIRVRIATGVGRFGVIGQGAVTIAASATGPGQAFSPRITVQRSGGVFLLTSDGRTVRWSGATLAIRGASLYVEGNTFASALVFAPTGPGAFDVVNHVGLETYLPGVLEHEFYKSWDPAAFRAQAIAARSYALVQMGKSQRRHYDVNADVSSQMFGGISTHDTSLQAAAATRGQVLTWQGRIVPAYYSSSSGGTGQDAAIAFPDGANIPPLRGREHGAWSANSKYFRWGPISRDRGDLSRRMAAWGRSKSHPVASLRSIASVTITARNSVGRPAVFTVRDGSGASYTLRAEEFRFACNFASPAPVDAAQNIRSSHVSVRVVGNVVQFYDGRGFGHGVGMDQHGAQSMALKGYNERSILAFYYPGAAIEKIY